MLNVLLVAKLFSQQAKELSDIYNARVIVVVKTTKNHQALRH